MELGLEKRRNESLTPIVLYVFYILTPLSPQPLTLSLPPPPPLPLPPTNHSPPPPPHPPVPHPPVPHQLPEQAGGTDWLPYASIDRLFSLCEARLARPAPSPSRFGGGKEGEVDVDATGGWAERQAGLALAFNSAQERLTEYFKVRTEFPIFFVVV